MAYIFWVFFLIKFWWWWWGGWFWWFESRPHGLSHTVRDIRVGAWVYVCVWRFYPMHTFFFFLSHLEVGPTWWFVRTRLGLYICRERWWVCTSPGAQVGPVCFANILHQFTRICIYSPAALSMWAPLWGHTNSWGRWGPNDIRETNLCAKFELH